MKEGLRAVVSRFQSLDVRAGLGQEEGVFQAAPRLPDNHALRYMARRLLGDDASLLPLVRGARQQQGLLQVLMDHCGNDEGDCRGCDFPLGS